MQGPSVDMTVEPRPLQCVHAYMERPTILLLAVPDAVTSPIVLVPSPALVAAPAGLSEVPTACQSSTYLQPAPRECVWHGKVKT